jgi:hypothetical protein
MITYKLKHREWLYVATAGKKDTKKFRSRTETIQFVKEKFNGDFSMPVGCGQIEFKSEEDLTWFLLTVC